MSIRVVEEESAYRLECQITDTFGDPVADEVITAITLTLYDQESGEIINSRDAQSVLNANDGTYTPELTVSGASKTNPVVVTTSAAHGLRSGDLVHIVDVGGMTQINDRTFAIRRKTPTSFELVGENGLAHTAYTSGGTAQIGMLVVQLSAADMVIVGAAVDAGQYERHVALIQASASGRVVNREIEFDVRQLAKVT